MPSRGKILVIRGGAIGDFILTLPAISALRRNFPHVHLEILGYPHIANLALAGGQADRIRSVEAQPLALFFARGGELSDELRDYFASFDIIVSYLYDPDKIFQTNVAICSKAQFIAGPHRPNETEDLHAAQVFLQPLERLAIFDADPIPRISLNSEISTLNQIAFHPGSGSERKNWLESNWAELAAKLLEEIDIKLLLVGGEAEQARLKNLCSRLPEKSIEVLENRPLVDLAFQLKNCAGFVGHDSGISHLAAALGVPGLVLWGDSNEGIWKPLNPSVKVVRSEDGLNGISVQRVLAEMKNSFLKTR